MCWVCLLPGHLGYDHTTPLSLQNCNGGTTFSEEGSMVPPSAVIYLLPLAVSTECLMEEYKKMESMVGSLLQCTLQHLKVLDLVLLVLVAASELLCFWATSGTTFHEFVLPFSDLFILLDLVLSSESFPSATSFLEFMTPLKALSIAIKALRFSVCMAKHNLCSSCPAIFSWFYQYDPELLLHHTSKCTTSLHQIRNTTWCCWLYRFFCS